ncbi:pilus assembly protein [Allosaccharopolyspora coralli]|uniref:Pilus assembly protein n=1 Tax=Allosaccharopolyspora coralli TaxID=2665642 RepID=A0A5Q3Q6Q8_9PSEU|nr:TadE/TadG family type IV pilus assembly protein [Allosaccharopolyspora coralli]QGK70298.1 pilus assembly protein [Allosaccharopolyspora coralli]
MTTRTAREDTGATSIELAVLTPVVLLVLALVIAGARIVTAHAALDHAVTAAARSASLARSPTTAVSTARDTALHGLADQALHCHGHTTQVDTSGFGTRAGTTGRVTVTLDCPVPLGDLLLPGIPGVIELSTSFTSTVDPFRGRT